MNDVVITACSKKILYALSITTRLQAHEFLVFAWGEIVKGNLGKSFLTKELYPGIGKRFNTSGSCVERAIRHAVAVSYDRFTERYRSLLIQEKPTSGDFILMVADILEFFDKNGYGVLNLLAPTEDDTIPNIFRESYEMYTPSPIVRCNRKILSGIEVGNWN